MNTNIKNTIIGVIDKVLPPDGVGTERDKLRIQLLHEISMLSKALAIDAYKEGFKCAIDTLSAAYDAMTTVTTINEK